MEANPKKWSSQKQNAARGLNLASMSVHSELWIEIA
jgi:hypothetical protein